MVRPILSRAVGLVLIGVVGLVGLVGLLGCSVPASSNPLDPRTAVDQFIAARQARNLEAAMASFADQPVMRSSLGVSWTGREAVRAIIAYRLADDYTVNDVQVGGDRVTWSEHVRRGVAGGAPANFDEDVEAVVVGGKIASMVTYVGGAHPALVVVPSPPSTDLFMPLSILLLVAGAVLVWPSAAPAPARAPPNGRLLEGLRDYVVRRG